MKKLFSLLLWVLVLAWLWTVGKRYLAQQTGGERPLAVQDAATTAQEIKHFLSDTAATTVEQLSETIGRMDTSALAEELKQILSRTAAMTDEELRQEILNLAARHNISLSERQTNKLMSLCRSLEGLDGESLRSRVSELQETVKKFSDARDTADGILSGVGEAVKTVGDFFYAIGDVIG